MIWERERTRRPTSAVEHIQKNIQGSVDYCMRCSIHAAILSLVYHPVNSIIAADTNNRRFSRSLLYSSHSFVTFAVQTSHSFIHSLDTFDSCVCFPLFNVERDDEKTACGQLANGKSVNNSVSRKANNIPYSESLILIIASQSQGKVTLCSYWPREREILPFIARLDCDCIWPLIQASTTANGSWKGFQYQLVEENFKHLSVGNIIRFGSVIFLFYSHKRTIECSFISQRLILFLSRIQWSLWWFHWLEFEGSMSCKY